MKYITYQLVFFKSGKVLYKKSHFIQFLMISTLLISASSFAVEQSLDHLSLKQSIQLFELNNREVLLAKRNVDGAEADILTAGQMPNPVLSIGASNLNLNTSKGNPSTENNNNLTSRNIQSVLQVSQLFERGDKRNLRIAAANKAFSASQFDFKDTLRQQQLTLKNAYYDLLLAQETEKIQQINVELYAKSLNAAELRLKAGDVASSDVARIKVDALRSQNDLRQSLANRQKAQSNLAYLIGKENNANEIVVTDTWPSVNVDIVNQVDKADFNNRPDILAAEIRTKQADDMRSLANSLKSRDITVDLAYQHFPGQEPGVGVNTIGATVSFPLFTNYEYQGEIGRAETNYYLAQDSKEQIKALAIGERNRAESDLTSAIDRAKRYDEQTLHEAQKVADAAEFAYQHGAIDVTDLLDARRTLRSTQLDAATSHADYAKSLAAWHAATQIEKN